jgi:DNA-binding response OmpR family regulator
MGTPSPLPRVIILDDEPIARDLLRRYLTRREYQPIETATIDDAVAALRAGPVDAVILDYRLGEHRTGLDVLRQFRADAPHAAAPVIMLTGAILTDAEETEIARHRGFLFHKPESLDTLMDFLDQLLGRDRPV